MLLILTTQQIALQYIMVLMVKMAKMVKMELMVKMVEELGVLLA